MAKIVMLSNPDPEHREYLFHCPGCKMGHTFITVWGKAEALERKKYGKGTPTWAFNGDLSKPSFAPSLLYPSQGCHLFLKEGVIEFLSDCKHALAGQKVPLPDLDLGDT